MSARSKARKQALDLLYETDIRGTNLVETLIARDVPAEGPDARPIREYTRELVNGVSDNRRKIEKLITSADRRLAAASKEMRVRVESSAKRFTIVRPRQVTTSYMSLNNRRWC